MTEEVKSSATPKKTATKKKSTTTTATKSTKTTSKPKAKKFDLDTLVRCKSVRQNELFYVATTGARYVWNGFGDIRELPYQEIVSMRASRSPFLYEPWLIIEDEDLLKKSEFKTDFEELYKLYAEFDNPKEFFEQPASVIRERLAGIPNGLRDLIVYNAASYIEDGSLDRMSVVNALDDLFGTNLKMLMV